MVSSRKESDRLNMICCNLCGGSDARPMINKNGYTVYRCAGCGLAFTHPQPESLGDQYDADYFKLYQKRRSFRLKRSDSRLRTIELMRAPGRLLDIGCSLGYFVEGALARGWQARGLEISAYASEEARKGGLDVATGALDAIHYPDASFDCVTMWDVLEHVPDPTQHMVEVSRILPPEGLVVIGTPNLAHVMFRLKGREWRHLKPSEHIFYFTPATAARLLEKTGFPQVQPPLAGYRKFRGALGTAIRAAGRRKAQINDVMTIYGVKQ